MSDKNKPVHKIKLWPLTAAIWQQKGTDNNFYNVTLERTYKKDGKWHNTGSIGRDDLLPAAKVMDAAHSWIVRRETEERQAAKQSPPDE